MKPARLAVLGIAIVAGGTAAYLASRPEAPQQVVVAAPAAAPANTVDVLVAKKDIGVGQTLLPQDMEWVSWPASASNPAFVRRADRPDGIEQIAGSIARSPIASGEPVREGKLIKAKGSGYMAAILPSGMRAVSTEISPETGAGGFILPNDRVDVILSRRDREAERLTGIESQIAETLLSDVRCSRSTRTSKRRTASGWWSAAPRRWSFLPARSRRSPWAGSWGRSRLRCAASQTPIRRSTVRRRRTNPGPPTASTWSGSA
jgi:pilus assembly protein CpaB